ncbi:hypothetical protein TVAG_310190 [Trichomonas vaginalis G3]|uniref:Uncharacterized protein n=1 Tax=Trichomonas vaginalis (strain ATCC PRA-98 / G3) TaxID=412133 RepID=A2EKT5_TRIV3|nr:hypothetical protein TVAGG3_0865260 [Trichomonas vaginalis G3]EAY06732.1 hypothetical protein TVAG_310190 [Trichomonas vaginalis G3]KAI5500975.1 hypothetical protein TVAGG3_0865260 [Trichomonas vaginalis G3]|eukprot:XP_001318955.1 hypothetical protein [Trichomonas vaginalis G3]
MYSDDKQFQLLELEFARLETKLSRQPVYTEKKHRKSHRKPRWNLDDLKSETKYLDYLARKALSPVKFYPTQPKFDENENLSQIYPKITQPHRIDPKISFVTVNNKSNVQQMKNNQLSEIRPSIAVNLMTDANVSLGFKPKKKKHDHHHREPVIRIKKSPEKQYPRNTAKSLVLGTPPEAGLDAALDTFIDNIEAVGKWAE